MSKEISKETARAEKTSSPRHMPSALSASAFGNQTRGGRQNYKDTAWGRLGIKELSNSTVKTRKDELLEEE